MAGYGSGIGGLLGGAAGFAIGGPMGASLGAGAGGMLGGLFDQPDQIDTSGLYRLQHLYEQRANQFFDPNSNFYTQATNNQRRMLSDMYSAGVSKMQKQLASQGINSNSMAAGMMDNASTQAGDQANQFASNLYSRGASIGASLLRQAGNMQQTIAGVNSNNVGMNNSFSDQYMSMFGSLLGQGMPSMLQQQYTTPQAGSFANPVGVQQSVTQRWEL